MVVLCENVEWKEEERKDVVEEGKREHWPVWP